MTSFTIIIVAVVLLLVEGFGTTSRRITDEREALKFLLREHSKYIDECKKITRNYSTEVELTVDSFNWKSFSNPKIKRAFWLLSKGNIKLLPDDETKVLMEAIADMSNRYESAEIPVYNAKGRISKHQTVTMDPDLKRIFATSRNYNELEYYWKAWRDAVGKPSRSSFETYVQLINKLAQKNGFLNNKEMWLSEYEQNNINYKAKKLYEQILPLYQQLHYYVRRHLIGLYGSNRILDGGPIPAHLVGMFSTVWTNYEDLLSPFPHIKSMDIEKNMKKKDMTVIDLVKLAENFYKSLGLPSLYDEFWERSTFVKPAGKKQNCHPFAYPGCAGRGMAIQMCAEVSLYYLYATFHELGHVYYDMAYANLLSVFQDSANPAFHEAVGDAIYLFAGTPDYLHSIGLSPYFNETEHDMNYLLASALLNIPNAIHAFTIEQWRYDVFDNSIPLEDMNKKWWEYRLKYQGVCPPVRRTEEDFDPASIIHFSDNIPYIRYFFSKILQYQFHKGMCEASGHTGPLYKCNIHGSVAAGKRLRNMMESGRSRPWPDILSIITENESQMNAAALLEYYKPLYDWLVKQNHGKTIEWNSDDATICP